MLTGNLWLVADKMFASVWILDYWLLLDRVTLNPCFLVWSELYVLAYNMLEYVASGKWQHTVFVDVNDLIAFTGHLIGLVTCQC